MNTYGRLPVAFVRGSGCYLWDAEGKKYLDMLSGIAVNALGHSHPAIVEVVTKQVATLVHTSNLYHVGPQAELAQQLCENSFADKVFFSNSGAEANETAIKLARIHAKKFGRSEAFEIITIEKSFHGRTLATIAATGQAKVKQGFEPVPAGFSHVPLNDLNAAAGAISERTCAIMVEPVLGEGGVLFPQAGYLKGLRELCDQHQILLIFDEIQTGLGRTGKFFAYEHSGVIPDVLTLAKALGAGLPIGACLAKDSVAQAFGPGTHASTFGGNFLVCEAAKKFLEILASPNFLSDANAVGEYFLNQLELLKGKYSVIKEVRGKGMMLGVDLSISAQDLVKKALGLGLLINAPQAQTLRFLPPLILTKSQVDEAILLLSEVFAQVGEGV